MEKIRDNGILMHISSLPNENGIGTLGECAYRFIDFLVESKVNYWQILPIGHTSYGDSPYQTYSIYAGNPYFIDLDILVADKLLFREEIFYNNNGNINYGDLFNTRIRLLKLAYSRFDLNNSEYIEFICTNSWVNDYACFMTLKEEFQYKPINEWGDKYRVKTEQIYEEICERNYEKISFWKFTQFLFFNQWYKLKEYANQKGVNIIGDMPIYVPYDSVEVWTNPNYFLLDNNYNMEYLSGAPADNFSNDGQIWGSPLYNYQNMKKDNFCWWVNRIKFLLRVFDMLRIDHFIGFDSFFAIPAKTRNAREGIWMKGDGFALFNEVNKHIDNKKIIAEDLGHVTESVRKLLLETGYLSMKVLQFGLDGNEYNTYFPKNYNENCVCYTGTHDNYTLKEWLKNIPDYQLDFIKKYTNKDSVEEIIKTLIKKLLESNAKIVIIPIQDYLQLGDEARMNIPGKIINNWTWRISKHMLDRKLSINIREIVMQI